ncbi:T9SS type A sorting domain-containing protein [bacterium]|nr:T9SS type A sorting domain-containing protein [bacterium]
MKNLMRTGGAIYCGSGTPTISNNLISYNHAEARGIDLGPYTFSSSAACGGAISCAGSPVIINNIITNNYTYGFTWTDQIAFSTALGGAIHCHLNSSPKIINCRIENNFADATSTETAVAISSECTRGGAIYSFSSNPIIINSVITNNSTYYDPNLGAGNSDFISEGGAIYSAGGNSIEIINSTITNNQAAQGGGIYSGDNSSLINTVLWGNNSLLEIGHQAYMSPESIFSFEYCAVEGGSDSINVNGTLNYNELNCITLTYENMSSEEVGGSYPYFNNPDGDDYSLQESSVLINRGTPTLATGSIDYPFFFLSSNKYSIQLNENADIELPYFCLDHNSRYSVGRVDIGAYEKYIDNLIWTGSKSSDWNNPQNWNLSIVPSSEYNVIIPAVVPIKPTISTPETVQVKDLLINNNAILNVDGDSKLTISGDLINNGIISLKSNSVYGCATLLDKGSATGTGLIEVESLLDNYGSVGIHYLSSPVSNALSGVIKSTTGNKLLYYDEEEQDYSVISDNFTELIPCLGYVALTLTKDTYTFSGNLNTGNQIIELPYSPKRQYQGFNLIGNPYPSFLNWDEVVRTGIGSSVWYRDEQQELSTFQTYNSLAKLGTGRGNSTIFPLQAFWVLAESSGAILEFDNSMRSHKYNELHKIKSLNDSVLRLQISIADYKDEVVMYYNTSADNTFDEYDSKKIFEQDNDVPKLFSLAGTTRCAINGLNDQGVVTLGIETNTYGTCSIEATEIIGFKGTVLLKDTKYNTIHNLNAEEDYVFTISEGDSANRFEVIYILDSPTKIQPQDEDEGEIQIKCINKELIINLHKQFKGEVEIYDINGSKLIHEKLISNYNSLTLNFSTGYYFVKVVTENKSCSEKILIY